MPENTSTNTQPNLPNSPLPEFDIREIFITMMRRKEIILGITSIIVVLTTIILFLQAPLYTATASIVIDARGKNIVDIEEVMSGISGDEAAIRSELDIINSRELIGQVVDKLNLKTYEEFSPSTAKEPNIFKKIIVSVMNIFKPGNNVLSEDKIKQRERSQIITNVKKHLNIVRKTRSYTINIHFTSRNPELAAKIANTIADEYLLSQLTSKFQATKRANEWLNKKLSELQKKVHESEILVESFKKKHGLIESSGVTINDQQLSELNSQLILARTEAAQAEARLKSAKESKNTSSEVLNSRLIQSLRSQEAEVLRKKSDLRSRYGARHPKIINVNSELRDLRAKISEEIAKVMSSLENELQVSRTREKALEESLRSLETKAGTSGMARVQLSELQRQMVANQTLYKSFLSRFKETSENQDFEQADARIISFADIPMKPSFPRKKLIFLISVVLGFGLGVSVAMLLEHLDNTFKSPEQFENITGVSAIGMVPELNTKLNFVDYISKKLSSIYTESIRSILTAIHFYNPDHPVKSLMVTSSIPKEGKSCFTISLATVIAKSGGKVLIIDCDLKRPSIGKNLNVESKYGLADLLAGDVKEEDAIQVEKRSGISFIASKQTNIVNSQDLLGSNKMKEFLDRMTQKFDLVILDTPPIMPVSDALIVSKIVDACVFMARWDKSPKELVLSSLKQLKSCNAKVAGAVLTRVNLDKNSKYSYGNRGYYYHKYKEYYTN